MQSTDVAFPCQCDIMPRRHRFKECYCRLAIALPKRMYVIELTMEIRQDFKPFLLGCVVEGDQCFITFSDPCRDCRVRGEYVHCARGLRLRECSYRRCVELQPIRNNPERGARESDSVVPGLSHQNFVAVRMPPGLRLDSPRSVARSLVSYSLDILESVGSRVK